MLILHFSAIKQQVTSVIHLAITSRKGMAGNAKLLRSGQRKIHKHNMCKNVECFGDETEIHTTARGEDLNKLRPSETFHRHQFCGRTDNSRVIKGLSDLGKLRTVT
ncbi:hypothetical protein AVEN_241657-1 [Araneus ventricosus]|uniref:Uncharacterized protein n=1 Tax=Araneus ventricosus TaxID=182803 RepID=A0A4Y2JTM5_ARAVE|nr:hypothetical protein AVEN_241657-1 [Araneus ventricosus]